MNTQLETKKQRQHYIDWLRILAFGLLFLFHSWRPFDHFPWHIKNEDQNLEDITKDDLYKVGTVGKILKTINLPDGSMNIFLNPLKRMKIMKFIERYQVGLNI